MRDVPDQLRDYWAGITADLAAPLAEHAMAQRIGAGDVRPVQDRPGPESRRSARSGWQQPAVVATAAAAAALILFGGGTLFGLSLGNGNDVTNETTVPTTVAPTTVPTSTTTLTATTLPGIVAVPVPVGFTGADESLLAVSAREVWTVGSPDLSPQGRGLGVLSTSPGAGPPDGSRRPRTGRSGPPPTLGSSPSTGRSGPGGSTRPRMSPSTKRAPCGSAADSGGSTMRSCGWPVGMASRGFVSTDTRRCHRGSATTPRVWRCRRTVTSGSWVVQLRRRDRTDALRRGHHGGGADLGD